MAATLDGTSTKAIHDHIIATVPEPSITFERDELQHRVERAQMELARRDKELEGYSKQVSRLQKEVKVANAEMTSLRDRNEQLQQSLMNARLANQNARDDADARLSESRIRELELALSASIHKSSKFESELESAKLVVEGVDARVHALNAQIEVVESKERAAMENLFKMSMQLKTAQELFSERDKEATTLRNEKYATEYQMTQLTETLQAKKREADAFEREAADLKKKVTDLSNLLNVRAETNAMLRQQMDEINGTKFVVTKEEMEKFKKMERDAEGMVRRIRELVKSVDLQMDLLQRSEAEAEKYKAEMGKSTQSETALRKEYDDLRYKSGSALEKLKAATKEVIKLRRDNKDLVLQVEELHKNPNLGRPEFERMTESLAQLGRSKAEESEAKQQEAKKRRVAEESSKAMRNRISFLLEQLEQASAMSVAWQEQKAVLKAEVSALHSTNKDLRRRLSSVQSYYTERHVAAIAEKDDHGDYDNNRRGGARPGDILSGKAGLEISALGGAYENAAASTLPTSVESHVERALFDTICAFSSGTRSTMYKQKKKGESGPTNLFKVKLSDEGVLLIEANNADADVEIEARELLTGMQVNPFLRFCQTRPPAKSAALFTEKIASVLNLSRNRLQEVVEQLGDSRMEVARATARSTVSLERVQRLRERFHFERLAKQKNVIKYVREQMRHSDMRIVINDLHKKALEYISEIDIAMNAEQRSLKEFMQQITHTAEELSAAVASSGTNTGPPGAMEVRLPDTQLDDETLHGVVGLLSGVLEDQAPAGPMTRTAATPQATSLLSSALLAKTVLSSSSNYMGRVLQLNLKGNQLTDLTCKILANVVETSPDLRLLDLRENCMTEKGAKVLFDATRRNITILYVTQRQNGFMIEGHREIAGGVTQSYKEKVPLDSQVEFERLVGAAKHPLRIDMRHNDANPVVIEGILESAMLNPSQPKIGAEGPMGGNQLPSAFGPRGGLDYSEDPNEIGRGQWSQTGLMDSVRNQGKYARPASAAATTRNSGSAPLRPQSAIVGGRADRPPSPNVAVAVGGKAFVRQAAAGHDSDSDEREDSEAEGPQSRRSQQAEHRGLIEMIESGGSVNKAVAAATGGIGSVLDESIRQIQENGGMATLTASPGQIRGKKIKKKTVNETILTDTKRVYTNKMHFPGEEEAMAVIEARRRAAQASLSAGGGHGKAPAEEGAPKKRPASAGVAGRVVEPRGGGAASAAAASTVRARLNAVKTASSSIGSGRPMSATATGSGSKHSSAHSLLDGLQRLNPAALF